jgi:hypothetical protein
VTIELHSFLPRTTLHSARSLPGSAPITTPGPQRRTNHVLRPYTAIALHLPLVLELYISASSALPRLRITLQTQPLHPALLAHAATRQLLYPTLMLAFAALPIALHVLLSTLLITGVSAAGRQCALIPPKGFLKASTGGPTDGDHGSDSGSGGGGGGDGDGSSGGGGPANGGGSSPDFSPCVRRKVSAAWYTGWHATQYPPSAIAWDKYSLLTYSFATTTGGEDPLYLSDWDQENLPKFVDAAHAHVGVSIAPVLYDTDTLRRVSKHLCHSEDGLDPSISRLRSPTTRTVRPS